MLKNQNKSSRHQVKYILIWILKFCGISQVENVELTFFQGFCAIDPWNPLEMGTWTLCNSNSLVFSSPNQKQTQILILVELPVLPAGLKGIYLRKTCIRPFERAGGWKWSFLLVGESKPPYQVIGYLMISATKKKLSIQTEYSKLSIRTTRQ